jgi:hypothetical protein
VGVPGESGVKNEAQNMGVRAGVKCSCRQNKGGCGYIPLLLGEVNQSIFFRGKGGTMHLSPNQTAIVDVSQRRTCLLSALAKCQNVYIINKANRGDGGVRRVAKVDKVSIIEEKQNRR